MSGDVEGLTDSWLSPTPGWSAVRNATLGYARLTFHNASAMQFEYVLSESGQVHDEFTIVRE